MKRVAVAEIVAVVRAPDEDRDLVRRRVLDVIATLGLCVDSYEYVDDPDPLPRPMPIDRVQTGVRWSGGRRRR